MSGLIAKIWSKRWVLRSIVSTIRFNVHYLPLKQALKLPMLLYKPKLKALKGKIIIDAPISTGMIQMGRQGVSIYPDTGITIENRGGEIVFRGRCVVGSASAISVGEHGHLDIGDDFMANAALKVAAHHSVTIGHSCRVAWDCTIIDTDFHKLTLPDGSTTRGYAPVSIGHNCWIGTGCLLLKSAQLPPFTTVQARTVISKPCSVPERSVIGNDAKVVVKASDTYRNLADDKVDFTK